MSPTENKALIHRLYNEAINRQDAIAAAGFYAPDAMNHGRMVGRAGMQRVFEALFSTFVLLFGPAVYSSRAKDKQCFPTR